MDKGGNSDDWEKLKTENKWKFKKDSEDNYQKYLKEVKYSADRYYELLPKIQQNWSKLVKEKDFNGKTANQIEKDCLNSIKYYINIKEIDEKYGETTPNNVPAMTRLSMLYEKQEKYEEAISVCKQACNLGVDESSRMKRLIKKVGREAFEEEKIIISKFLEN